MTHALWELFCTGLNLSQKNEEKQLLALVLVDTSGEGAVAFPAFNM